MGLVETRERTGILIYVSLLEHRVVVLADRGIHSRVEAGTWDAVVERVVVGIRENRAEAGLADGIRLCGEILAERFPIRAGDLNELPNRRVSSPSSDTSGRARTGCAGAASARSRARAATFSCSSSIASRSNSTIAPQP